MENKTADNCIKTHGILLANLDPRGELLYDCSDLVICKECLKLFGRITIGNVKNQEQKIDCYHLNCKCVQGKAQQNGKGKPRETGHVLKTSIQFCQCCSMELINFGSGYSDFFCRDCLKTAIFYNEINRKNKIPLGKHSFLNGTRLIYPYTREEVDQFKVEIRDFFNKITLIIDWQKYSLFENLHDLGFDLKQDVPLSLYNSLIVELQEEKQTKFRNMVEYISINIIS